MASQSEPAPEGVAPTPSEELSTEIGASLASVWARYAGSRPPSAETELDGNAVRWILAGGAGEIEKGIAASDGEDGRPMRTERGYRRELTTALQRVTRRRVSAHISKDDAKTGVASEVFILEARHRSN
jgi:hypothetical protein